MLRLSSRSQSRGGGSFSLPSLESMDYFLCLPMLLGPRHGALGDHLLSSGCAHGSKTAAGSLEGCGNDQGCRHCPRGAPHLKKKSLELLALRIAPWFPLSFNGPSDIARTDAPNHLRQVFWLTDHPTHRAFPSCPQRDSGSSGFRPRLQRRDRSRISRDSLLNSKHLMVFP